MAFRPTLAKDLPPMEVDASKLVFPLTKQKPEHIRRGSDRPDKYDQMKSKWEPRLQMLDRDLKFSPSDVGREATYFQTYSKTIKAHAFGPLVVQYCNYCWNNWPIIGIMMFDKLTMVRFVRGQCCPYCEKDEKRANINDSLMRNGPSKYFIEQAQAIGFRTDRFPYVGTDNEPIRMHDLFSINAPCYLRIKDLWDEVRPLVVEPNPDL